MLAQFVRQDQTPGLVEQLKFENNSVDMASLPVNIFSASTNPLEQQYSIIGTYDPVSGGLSRVSKITFMGSTNEVPPAFPPPEIVSPASDVVIALTAVTSLALVVCFICTLWLIKKRNTPIIRASSFMFGLIINVGAVLVLISVLVRLNPQPYSACFISTLLFDLGVQLSLGSIFVKSFRIHRIFNNFSLPLKRYMSNKALLLQVLPFVAYSLVLDFAWLGAKYEGPLISILSLGDNQVYYKCSEPGMWLILRAIPPVILLILCTILAYNLRGVRKENFNGSFGLVIV